MALVLAIAVTTGVTPASASGVSPLTVQGPVALEFSVQPLEVVRTVETTTVDIAAVRAEDQQREEAGLAPRFALTETVNIAPDTDGTWETLDSRHDLWRLRITSPGALSINLGFTGYRLPKGARLTIYPADASGPTDPRGVRNFTNGDNETHGELWTPVVLGDDIVVELMMPRESRRDYVLELTAINKGYRFFGEILGDVTDKSESCNLDVVCTEGDDWRREISSVGVISTGGNTYCSGFMINNTALDARPLFMTADHCGINALNAASLVVYWNYESPSCGQQDGGVLDQFMTGSIHLASLGTSDFTLVEMDDPVDPDHGVSFAGWNNSSDDPQAAVAIHHPNTDEKSISFEDDPTTTTTYFGTSVPGDGSHIRVADWDLGTTEGGSSGSPLFDQDHHVVGQLHGGYASCGNDLADWYGRLSVSWPLISQHLDPLDYGVTTLNTYAPFEPTMTVAPLTGAVFEGQAGGPFQPAVVEYVITNHADVPLTYAASAGVPWVDVTPGNAMVPEGASRTISVTTNASASNNPQGLYTGSMTIVNLTDDQGNTTLPLQLTVGLPMKVHSFPLNTDPGWTTEDQWAFGQPQGSGGDLHGNPDPAAGRTGSYVYGFNLDGDYPAYLPERHLVTEGIDCSDLEGVTLKFWRWLNVEQSTYDHASVAVSHNGIDFTTIWENSSEIADAAWVPVQYDIGAVADGQTTVYIRWTMGATDSNWQFSGWNIDDVEIWGLRNFITATEVPSGYRLSVGNHPNPFNPMTTISFVLEKDGPVAVNIYNLNGRLVRALVDDSLAAGPQSVPWDGLDDAGQRVGSGVYLVQVLSDGRSAEHKMVLLK
jgi:hypothetical protein